MSQTQRFVSKSGPATFTFLLIPHLILALMGGQLLFWCSSFLSRGGDLVDIFSRKICENLSLIPGIMIQIIEIL